MMNRMSGVRTRVLIVVLMVLVLAGTTLACNGTATVVATSDATGVTATSATLNGGLTQLGEGVTSVEVSFEWATDSGEPYDNETTPETLTAVGAFSFSLTGLTPSTTYYFRAKGVGNSTVYGEEMKFTTSGAPAVATNAPSSVSGDAATLNGTLLSSGGATNVQVSFEWDNEAGAPYGNETTPQTISTPDGIFSSELAGLASGTTYYFRAKVVTDGYTAYGEELVITTLW